ncbi:MAG TPA: serine/threonine-protein kinase [Candidatus Sulfotelmatobacter sp.]|jgi:serine/threonine protein kinase|nr:serine/threonine-protein kinase [Candidatus Sulfotelmatobacter sp.]
MPTLTSRYEVIETLGTGATSRVDKALDTLIGRTVALKTFQSGFGSRQLQEQFLREAQIVGQLAHSSIVSLYDVGTDHNGFPYFVMEYVEGETLEKALETAPLPLEKASAWGGDLATALSQAHQAKIIHGDVKPANILITREGRPKLGDFGIARYATHASGSGTLNGTPAFLSPEQILDQAQDARSDLFSLGIVLYQMTTGVHPFDGSSVAAVCGQIVSSTPVPPSHLNPALPPEFDRIVMCCLAKNPDARFATAQDLAAALYPLARTKKAQAAAGPGTVAADPSVTSLQENSAPTTALRRPLHPPSQKTAWRSITSWWRRPVRGSEVWLTSASAGILVLALFLLVQLRFHRSTLYSAPPEATSLSATTAPATPPAVLPSLSSEPALSRNSPGQKSPAPLSSDTPILQTSAAAKPSTNTTLDRQPAKAVVPRRNIAQKAAVPPAVARKPSVAGNVGSKSPKTAAAPGGSLTDATPSAARQTSLNIAVVSDVGEETLAIYSDDNLLLTTPLESAHRGDTLRFSCPIAAGDHVLRVTVFRDAREVVAQKENSSELHADGSNTLEVHIYRRSRMLVKHQIALEIVWPSRSLSSAIQQGAGPESTSATLAR